MSSEPPEEPQYRNELSIQSPASPKPIHFPTPTNIHVLEMQHDVGFNQTEAHMGDPAAHNTEIRPNLWRDPNDAQEEQNDAPQPGQDESAGDSMGHASPYSTGAQIDNTMELETGDDALEAATASEAHSTSTEPTAAAATAPNLLSESRPVQLHDTSAESPSEPPNGAASALSATDDAVVPSSDPSVPAGEPFVALASQVDPPFPEASAPSTAPVFNPSPVDVQALLDTFKTATPLNATANTAPPVEGLTIATTESSAQPNQAQQQPTSYISSPVSASGLSAPPSGLPPRPPPQEQPLIHPNYVHSQHIRDYHPHAAKPAFQPHVRSGSQGNLADPTSHNYVPPVNSPSTAQAAVQYQASQSSATAPPFANGQSAQLPLPVKPAYTALPAIPNPAAGYPAYGATPAYGAMAGQGTPPVDQGDHPRHEDRPWDAEVQRKYDRFIEEERKYVSEGRWEQFPDGARLFVGNLSSEKVTKRDIFHVFHTYGELAQISIKQAYGFVQFLRREDCIQAMETEQGRQIRDKRIHLEVSKPQKNRPGVTQRRSRSPDSGRGRPGGNVDRYNPGARGGNNDRREGYRPGYRSPSPRGYRDRYDDRYRRRSPSPAYGGRGGRYRSPSPRRDTEDDLPLPKRDPRNVPDVQIIDLASCDPNFVRWVEEAFTSRSVRADVLILSPRLSEQAVVRRQIVEGVAAVVKLTRQNQNTGKIGLQIFDRRNGVSNVTFEEYDGLDPPIAAELVLRAKTTHAAPPTQQAYGGGYQQQPSYGGYSAPTPSYGAPQPAYSRPQSSYPPNYPPQQSQIPPPGSASVPPNLQSLITNLDPNNLQNLLSAMNTPQSGGSAAYPGAPPGAVQALQQNPAMVNYLQQQQQQRQQQPAQGSSGGGAGQVNMQDILARLGGSGYGR